MHLVQVLDLLGAIVAAGVLSLAAITLRRRLLQRRGGTIDLSLRLRRGTHGRGWALGVGRFEGDALLWYRVFSLAPGPRRSLSRRELSVGVRREPHGPEALALLKGAVVMECVTAGEPVDLAMDPAAVTGFLAWIEATPPGAPVPH